jgi:hypothetical protein
MPIEQGVCPVCKGDKVTPTDYGKPQDCTNCGGQKQWGKPTGLVFLRKDGTPCKHEFTGEKLGNCYWGYICKFCPDSYSIDSGG